MKSTKRLIILNLGNCYPSDICGKDLFSTDAPKQILEEASVFTASVIEGSCAEDIFVDYVQAKGYYIESISILEDIEMYTAENKKF